MRIPLFTGVELSPFVASNGDGRTCTRVEKLALLLIIGTFAALGFAYSIRVPPFETPDEIHHYAFAQHLAQGNPLPVQTIESSGRWEHEGTQAPLYYFLLGRLIAGIDQSDFGSIDQVNPYANLGNPLYPGNKNYILYSAAQRPLSGTVLAVYIGRWFSLLLGICTLLLSYGIARMAFPGSVGLALLTLATTAAIPQFQFISATVSNDNAVILFATAVLFWLARLLAMPVERRVRWHDWLVLGVLLGAASLSKLQGLGLVPLTGLVVLGLAWWRHDYTLPLRALLPVAVPVLLIAGWWYWRNFVLYGDWLGVDQLLSINGMRTESRTLSQFWGELRGVRYSFWGLFGWFSILMPSFVYSVLDWISWIVVAGVGVTQYALWRHAQQLPQQSAVLRVHLLLFVWLSMLIALLVYWLTFATSGQGRLLFPALAAVGVCFVMGLQLWGQRLPWRFRYGVLSLFPLGLLLASLYALGFLLPASYRALPVVTSLPAHVESQQIVFGDQIELLGAEASPGRFQTGDLIDVTLYWRVAQPITKDYPLFVQLLAPDYTVLGNITSHPGWGRFPTTLWQPNQIYVDRYRLRVDSEIDARSPVVATIVVGFFDAVSEQRLVVQHGERTDATFAALTTVDLLPQEIPSTANLEPVDVQFGDVIRLTGYRFSDRAAISPSTPQEELLVLLAWEATSAPGSDYTAFVHLIDPTGAQVSGFDQPPAQGRFPTSHWLPGDRIFSQFPVPLTDVAPGAYEVWVGLYGDQAGATRLPVNTSHLPTRDQRVLLGIVTIH